MSLRKTYSGYSIGCAVVWGVILTLVAVRYPDRLHTYLLIGSGWLIGWLSATIARWVYPPPESKLPVT
jgi:pimeloyl-ACP methyl ester carboxylesterase